MHYRSRRITHNSMWHAIEAASRTLFFRIALAGVTLAGCFFYLAETNTVTANAYEVAQLNRQLDDLQDENRKLDVTLAEVQSISRISDEIEKLGYVPVEKVEYAAVGSAFVAKR